MECRTMPGVEMKRRDRTRWPLMLAWGGWLLGVTVAWGQTTAPADPSPVIHTVLQGETLRGLASRYFGDAERWPEIHRLNPSIADPNVLAIGQRVQVPYPDALPDDSALLVRRARRVENRISPLTWSNAEHHNVLRRSDAMRTFDAASAELVFPDTSTLVLTENSIVVVGVDRPARRPRPDEVAVEIVAGQADLRGSLAPNAEREIEIVLGDTAARPRPDAAGTIAARARKPEAGGAAVMMYAGDGEVEAAGATVALAAGTGSVVAEGEAPGPPETLLAAPVTRAPASGDRLATPRPTFSWAAVDGAVAYRLEICADPGCGSLEALADRLGSTTWQPTTVLPVTELFWRVTAVSPSGLDGYPSPPVGFTVTSAAEDLDGPTVAIQMVGDRVRSPRPGLHTVPIGGVGSAIEVTVDDPSGVAAWTAMIDGHDVAPDALRGPWPPGRHEVTVRAVDRAGNERRSDPFVFVYDPDPPTLRWGPHGGAALGERVGEQADSVPPSPALRGWRTWPTSPRRNAGWRLTSDGALVRLWPLRDKPVRVADVPVAAERGRGLWVLAEDQGCPGPLHRLVYGARDASSRGRDGFVLTVEAEDCVGNVSRLSWPIVPRKGG